MSEFKEHLIKTLKDKFKTQTALAEHLGVSCVYVHKMMTGKAPLTKKARQALGVVKVVAYDIEGITYIEELD